MRHLFLTAICLFRTEMKQLRNEHQVATRSLSKCKERLKIMDSNEAEHEKIHRKLRTRLTELEEQNQTLTRQVSRVWLTRQVSRVWLQTCPLVSMHECT